jgi:hypothetical protein
MALKIGSFGKQTINTLKVLICSAGEGLGRLFGSIV